MPAAYGDAILIGFPTTSSTTFGLRASGYGLCAMTIEIHRLACVGSPGKQRERRIPTRRRCAVECRGGRTIMNHVLERAARGGWLLFGRCARK
jgi:hypothetical protein